MVKNEVVKVMTCKDHNNGDPCLMIHHTRQPNHIIPSRYLYQMCHSVINPGTITPSKSQPFPNNYQMHEQRGNLNGIDSCSIPQYHNVKLLSYILHEN